MENNKGWKRCGEIGTLKIAGGDVKLVQSLWKMIWQYFKKLNMRIAILWVIPVLDILYNQNNCGYMHVHSNTIHNRQKVETVKMFSMNEQINKLWYIHTMKYCSAIKRNGLLLYTTMWIDLQNLMLSEGSQIQSHILYDNTYMKYPE